MGQNIQCGACGASSVIKHLDKSMLECRYCGALMAFSENPPQHSSPQPDYKPAKLVLLLVMLPIIVIALMVVFWEVFQKIRKHTTMDAYEFNSVEVSSQLSTEAGNHAHSGKLITNVESHATETLSADSISQNLTVQSQVSGVTTNGGKYWIFQVKNSGEDALAGPAVMVSLFNSAGKRVAEQGGWAQREILAAGEETAILVFLSDVPADVAEQQITTVARAPTSYGLQQVTVEVRDFSVKIKSRQFEIIGDVVNSHDRNVKYVRVVAVAYDAAGVPIGIGDAFSTVKNLAPNQQSGFKLRVGTFLTGEPAAWQVWALGRGT